METANFANVHQAYIIGHSDCSIWTCCWFHGYSLSVRLKQSEV